MAALPVRQNTSGRFPVYFLGLFSSSYDSHDSFICIHFHCVAILENFGGNTSTNHTRFLHLARDNCGMRENAARVRYKCCGFFHKRQEFWTGHPSHQNISFFKWSVVFKRINNQPHYSTKPSGTGIPAWVISPSEAPFPPAIAASPLFNWSNLRTISIKTYLLQGCLIVPHHCKFSICIMPAIAYKTQICSQKTTS